jgi:hypothetical protein
MKTTNLKLPRARWYDLPVPAMIGICLFCLFAIAGLVGRLQQTPAAAAVPTPALSIIVIATSPAVIVPTAAPQVQQIAVMPSNALRRAVVAYDAPAGNVLGAIEQGRAYSVLARYGADWLQADVDGSGVVWLRADQVLDLPADLADLQPTNAPQVIERPIYIAAQPAPAVSTPAPEQYMAASEPQPLPQQLVILDRQQWAQQAQDARNPAQP